MTKSRKRSSFTRRGSRGAYRPPDRPYRSIASQMTAAYERAMADGADAELRGDAAEGLRLHRSIPMFEHSTHGARLEMLADLGDAAPGWLVNRWLTVQARRRAWTGGDIKATNRALQLVVPMLYPQGIPFAAMGCAYVEQVLPFIYERDWVVRQIDLYELGALRKVLSVASTELLERADRIDGWWRAPMRACRMEAADRVTDLTSGEVLDVLDLGLGELAEPGQHLLGRVVPITPSPGAMFEWAPLRVDEATARAVARAPQRWLTILASLSAAGRLDPAYSHLPEASLTSDLPWRAWMSMVGVRRDEAPDRDPEPLVADAVQAALDLAEHGLEHLIARRHSIGDLLIDGAFTDRRRWEFARPELQSPWSILADAVPEPARSRARDLAMWCAATPELPDAIA